VVIDVETHVALRPKLEADVLSLVPDADKEIVRGRMPQEDHVEPVVAARRQFTLALECSHTRGVAARVSVVLVAAGDVSARSARLNTGVDRWCEPG
jgi:hypothetical protein